MSDACRDDSDYLLPASEDKIGWYVNAMSGTRG